LTIIKPAFVGKIADKETLQRLRYVTVVLRQTLVTNKKLNCAAGDVFHPKFGEFPYRLGTQCWGSEERKLIIRVITFRLTRQPIWRR